MEFYDILGVSKDATADEIKSAYRKKAKKMHPDVGGDKEEFAKLQEAFDTLSNPDARAFYDQTGGKREKEKTPRDRAVEIITEDVNLIIANLTQDLMDRGANLVDTLRNDLQALQSQMRKAKVDLESKQRLTEGVIDEVKGEVFQGVAKSTLDRITNALAKCDFDLEAIEIALDLCDGYSHDPKPKPYITDRTTAGDRLNVPWS